MLLALPSALYGNKEGAWDWIKPFTAHRRGCEVDPNFGRPSHTRVVHLNSVAIGDALERAREEGPSDEWVFTLVDWQGSQHLWVGTGTEASKPRGGRVARGGTKVVSLTAWTKPLTARVKGAPAPDPTSEEEDSAQEVGEEEEAEEEEASEAESFTASQKAERRKRRREGNARLLAAGDPEGKKIWMKVQEKAKEIEEMVEEYGCTQEGASRENIKTSLHVTLCRAHELFIKKDLWHPEENA